MTLDEVKIASAALNDAIQALSLEVIADVKVENTDDTSETLAPEPTV